VYGTAIHYSTRKSRAAAKPSHLADFSALFRHGKRFAPIIRRADPSCFRVKTFRREPKAPAHENNCMKNPRLFVLPVLALFAVAAAAQSPDQAPKLPAPTQDLAATQPSQSSSTSKVELFPTPEIPQLAATSPIPPSSTSHVELFPTPDIPAEKEADIVAPLTAAESEMQAQIQSAISKDPTLSGGNVNVSLSADGIELSGTVASVRARLAATRLAKSYAAGRKVVDKITIATSQPETRPEPLPTKADSAATTHQHP
jgi:hypothetical protein